MNGTVEYARGVNEYIDGMRCALKTKKRAKLTSEEWSSLVDNMSLDQVMKTYAVLSYTEEKERA